MNFCMVDQASGLKICSETAVLNVFQVEILIKGKNNYKSLPEYLEIKLNFRYTVVKLDVKSYKKSS